MYDQIPVAVAVPLIIVLWLLAVAIKFHWLQHFQNWAAQRRHHRRTRNHNQTDAEYRAMREYLRKDVQQTAALYKANAHGRHSMKGMKRP